MAQSFCQIISIRGLDFAHDLGQRSCAIFVLKEKFISEHFQAAGYRTALFGKWHLGFYQRAFTPLGRGFDEHLGYLTGVIDYYTHVPTDANSGGDGGPRDCIGFLPTAR